MEHFRKHASAESRATFFERALNGLSKKRSKSPSTTEQPQPSDQVKGPLGLNLLHSPSEPLIEFIFVHGLGGGSRKTWSKTADPHHYWPKEWLPKDPDFRNARIYSFGYAADWGEKKARVLEINDFARSLLGEIKDNPDIRRDETRIVLVAHSMGGLVIKKAYLLSREDPNFKDLASRFHTMYFLATPHRGADLSRTLGNILKVTYRQKPYINELNPGSALLSSINDSFRHYAQDLQLWSFYETIPSSLMVSEAIVVDKVSATLGYPNERTALLNADHRGVCKFDRTSDPNYKTLRNAFSTTIDSITAEAFLLRQQVSRRDLRSLNSLLGVSDPPEHDLLSLQDARVSGSCEWFAAKKEFEEWRVSGSSAPSVMWLSGNPASGKSVLAGYVVDYLAKQNLGCSYFFFKQDVETKSSVSDCLRSLAYQMALFNVEVRTKLLTIQADGVSFEKGDERSVWRKLFLDGVFQAKFIKSNYWVIDALDECNKVRSFFSTVASIGDHTTLRIFITSRKTQEIEQAFSHLDHNIRHVEIVVSDTADDIKLFIADRMDRLPVEDDESRANLTNRILEKSDGSFLWVRLVVEELEHTWSEEAIEEVLNDVPANMNLFYMRTLEKISKASRATKLAKAVLTWTVCALRPLTLSEMQCALKIDVNETVLSLDRSVSSICGQLVFVDQQSRIQMVHQTARDFLLREGLNSEFAISRADGHARLAVKCLEFLSGDGFKSQRAQKKTLAIKPRPAKDSALVDYACTFFSDHLYRASSLQLEPWDALYDFLSRNVLPWIEYLANTGDLYYITRTAMNFKAYLARRAKYFPPIGHQFQTVEAWSVDLIRVSARFRTSLLTAPSSIYWLIPPMCPSESIISRRFTSPNRGLAVKGAIAKTWDDCLTRISYRDSQATATDYGDRFFAVGLSTGEILVYYSVSGQVSHILEHHERVKILEFGGQDKLLASSGLRKIHIWDLSTGHQIWAFGTLCQILALAFASENEFLLAATQGDYVTCWSLSDGREKARIPWHDGIREERSKVRQRQPPTHASFSPDRKLLAVSYRGRSILLFDLESQVFFGECGRSSGLGTANCVTNYPIAAMTFRPSCEVGFLIVSYGDGELTIYNPWTIVLRHRVPNVNAHTLACSPNGRTLVTGSSFGTLQVFDFDGAAGEILTPIYRIEAHEEGIKSLAFSNDSLRFIDIRGSQCRVWEPEVLVRKDWEDSNPSVISGPVPMVPTSVKIVEGEVEAEITAMICHADGNVVFCGKLDGSIAVHLTQDGKQSCVLYKHATNIAITSIAWGQQESILASVDESSRIIVRRILTAQAGWSAPDILVDQRCADSVRTLLLNPANDRLLVSGKEFDELWTIQGQEVASKKFVPQKGRRVITHPLQPAAFISLEPDVAHIFNWADFKELTDSEGTKLNRSSEAIVRSSKVDISYHGSSILAELVKIRGDQPSTKLECWQTLDFEADSKSITPLPGFEMLGPCIEYVIAVNGTLLFFLDTDLWVCSLDMKDFPTTSEAKRHFFIATDWLSNSGDIIFDHTSKNEFIFVTNNGLVVIKRGTDYFEKISLRVQQ